MASRSASASATPSRRQLLNSVTGIHHAASRSAGSSLATPRRPNSQADQASACEQRHDGREELEDIERKVFVYLKQMYLVSFG